jgi:hypothetical protein
MGKKGKTGTRITRKLRDIKLSRPHTQEEETA